MKKQFLILIFCFLFLSFIGQDKTSSVFTKYNYSKQISFCFNASAIIKHNPQKTNYIFIKTQLPKLPFFCGMEDKFRNKFNVFLKIRAGNDESYMRMIQNTNK